MLDEPENLWDSILSRNAEQILPAFHSLTKEEQEYILNHLKRMVFEDGWHEAQRESAQTALDIIAKDELK